MAIRGAGLGWLLSIDRRCSEEEDMSFFITLKLLADLGWDGGIGVFAEHPNIIRFCAVEIGGRGGVGTVWLAGRGLRGGMLIET